MHSFRRSRHLIFPNHNCKYCLLTNLLISLKVLCVSLNFGEILSVAPMSYCCLVGVPDNTRLGILLSFFLKPFIQYEWYNIQFFCWTRDQEASLFSKRIFHYTYIFTLRTTASQIGLKESYYLCILCTFFKTQQFDL